MRTMKKTYDQTDLYGIWEQINPDPEDDGFNAIYHTFSNSEYGSYTDPYDLLTNYSFEYSWNNNGTVSWTNLLGFTVKLEIQTLTSSTLSFKKYKGGVFDDEYTCTKVD
jgi:hypothetical protein